MSNIFIKRIIINPDLGKCRVSFRSGVNVIWAENIKEAKSGSDFRNSVGKTTFIKLITFLNTFEESNGDERKYDK